MASAIAVDKHQGNPVKYDILKYDGITGLHKTGKHISNSFQKCERSDWSIWRYASNTYQANESLRVLQNIYHFISTKILSLSVQIDKVYDRGSNCIITLDPIVLVNGHGGAVVTHSPPSSEVEGLNVRKMVVVYQWTAV